MKLRDVPRLFRLGSRHRTYPSTVVSFKSAGRRRALGYRLFKCGERSYRGEEFARGDVTRLRHFDAFAVPDELA